MVPEFSYICVPDCIPTHTEIPVHEVEKYRYRNTGFEFGSVPITSSVCGCCTHTHSIAPRTPDDTACVCCGRAATQRLDVVWMRGQPLFCADTSPKRHSNSRSVMRHGVVMSRVVLRRSVLMCPDRWLCHGNLGNLTCLGPVLATQDGQSIETRCLRVLMGGSIRTSSRVRSCSS